MQSELFLYQGETRIQDQVAVLAEKVHPSPQPGILQRKDPALLGSRTLERDFGTVYIGNFLEFLQGIVVSDQSQITA